MSVDATNAHVAAKTGAAEDTPARGETGESITTAQDDAAAGAAGGRFGSVLRRPAVAHLLRAVQRYTTRLGPQFAGAVTYFSVLAVVPILMFAFSIAGFVLTVARPDLLTPIAIAIADALGQADPGTRQKVLDLITDTLSNYTSIGVFGLVSALYSGAGWMGNLKNAFRAQVRSSPDLQPAPGNIVVVTLVNLVSLLGLIVLTAVTFALASLSTSLSSDVVSWLGLDQLGWLQPVLTFTPLLFSAGAGWLLFRYLFASLPEQRLPPVAARRGALLGALGLGVLQYTASFLISQFSQNKAFALFGPVIALMLFFNLFAQLILFAGAWVATSSPMTNPMRVDVSSDTARSRDDVSDDVSDDAVKRVPAAASSAVEAASRLPVNSGLSRPPMTVRDPGTGTAGRRLRTARPGGPWIFAVVVGLAAGLAASRFLDRAPEADSRPRS